MGPRLFSRGMLNGLLPFPAPITGFNGAATFQPRNGYTAGNLDYLGSASMGPRLFSRGMTVETDKLRIALLASMGPRLFSRGMSTLVEVLAAYDKLQWGRDFSAAE